MYLAVCESVEAFLVRRTLTDQEDFRSDLAFQTDIDTLLTRIEEVPVPFRSVADLTAYSVGVLESGSRQAGFVLPSSLPARRTATERMF
jgi:hypothetical protein